MTGEVHWTRPDAPERMERFPGATLTPPDGRLTVLLRNGTAPPATGPLPFEKALLVRT
ncbi:hypothetical protein ACSHWB_42900 [Lentzea sp. HUAS TT2]|uniref:hypothetical protein n=1 Tax=Lentzea sp. HUAS TT2 TaxID=3447454 RepID=UPI003F7267AF